MMSLWRKRCPEGHTSIRIHSDTYRCNSCGVTYVGEPFDATKVEEFPVDEDERPESYDPVDDSDVLEELVEICDQPDRQWAKARDLDGGNTRQVGISLGRLQKDGLVHSRGSYRTGSAWRPTRTGLERVSSRVNETRVEGSRAQIDPLEGLVLFAIVAIGIIVLLALGVSL